VIHGREKIRIEELNDTAESFSEMIRDVRMGLLDVPKGLSPWPKYFYDESSPEVSVISSKPCPSSISP